MSELGQDRLQILLGFRATLYRSEQSCLTIIRQSQELIDHINEYGPESVVSSGSTGDDMPYEAELGDIESLRTIIRGHIERLESERVHVELINMEIEQMSVGPVGA